MWRIIVRIGYFGDTQSALRNRIVPELRSIGLSNSDTGTWEGQAVAATTASTQMATVLSILAQATSEDAGELEHLWIYIDRASGTADSHTGISSAVERA
jgi:hypothetical protein